MFFLQRNQHTWNIIHSQADDSLTRTFKRLHVGSETVGVKVNIESFHQPLVSAAYSELSRWRRFTLNVEILAFKNLYFGSDSFSVNVLKFLQDVFISECVFSVLLNVFDNSQCEWMLALALAEVGKMTQIIELKVLLVAWQLVLKLLSHVNKVFDLGLTGSEGACLVKDNRCYAIYAFQDVSSFY